MLEDSDLLRLMSRHVTEERLEKILQVSALRTRYITLAAENIYYSQNASALLRSCECFGIQDVHFIENNNKLPTINRHVALGTSRWLTIHRHRKQENNTLAALNYLKSGGYRIVATVPAANATPLPDFDLSKGPAAFIFGNERDGVSPIVQENADELLTIPMAGFAESFNISVSAAVILSHLTHELRSSEFPWRLKAEDLAELRLNWIRRTANRAKEVEDEYHRRFRDRSDSIIADVIEKDIPVGDQA